jgi:hypothetical protein
MMKKNPTPPKQSRTSKTDSRQPDYSASGDCMTSDCYDDNQRTFLEPCDDCEDFIVPPRDSDEGRILSLMLAGDWVTNESVYQAAKRHLWGAKLDGRKVLSNLRAAGLVTDREPLIEGKKIIKHRVNPRCLPAVNYLVTAKWKQLPIIQKSMAVKARQPFIRKGKR